MKIIINADDLGYSQTVNKAIFSLAKENRITSATLIANGEAFEDAIRRIRDFPDCSFGVHLTLTEFRSMTVASVFHRSGLVDEGGMFTGNLREIDPSPELKQAIYVEWTKQVLRIRDAGVDISHFDSHHHVHTVWWLFGVLKKLQKHFRIRKSRITLNWYYKKEEIPSRKLLFKKALWTFMVKHYYRTTTTDHFTPFKWFLNNFKDGEQRTEGIAELMVHPGQSFARKETEQLWGDWKDKLPINVELISYKDL